jgi:hypothetical protein
MYFYDKFGNMRIPETGFTGYASNLNVPKSAYTPYKLTTVVTSTYAVFYLKDKRDSYSKELYTTGCSINFIASHSDGRKININLPKVTV